MSDFDPDYWGARIRAAAQVVPKGEAVVGEKMTLEQVRERCVAWIADVACNGSVAGPAVIHIRQMFDHLTQPAQAVDVGAIREVIASHIEEAKKLRHDPESQDYLYEQADKLTAALPNANGKEDTDAAR